MTAWGHINRFGKKLPRRQDVAAHGPCADFVTAAIEQFLLGVRVAEAESRATAGKVLDAARRESTEEEFEITVHRLLESRIDSVARGVFFMRRINTVVSQIVSCLQDGPTLDFGCGAGWLGARLQHARRKVTLAEVHRDPFIERTKLPFVLLPQTGRIPLDSDQFSNIVASRVLHHCVDIHETLAELVRILEPGGRLVVVESIFDVEPGDVAPTSRLLDQFTAMSPHEQFCATLLLDYVWNRCVEYSAGYKVPFPGNYDSVENWQRTFESLGLTMTDASLLGVDTNDYPLVHARFVACRPG